MDTRRSLYLIQVMQEALKTTFLEVYKMVPQAEAAISQKLDQAQRTFDTAADLETVCGHAPLFSSPFLALPLSNHRARPGPSLSSPHSTPPSPFIFPFLHIFPSTISRRLSTSLRTAVRALPLAPSGMTLPICLCSPLAPCAPSLTLSNSFPSPRPSPILLLASPPRRLCPPPYPPSPMCLNIP